MASDQNPTNIVYRETRRSRIVLVMLIAFAIIGMSYITLQTSVIAHENAHVQISKYFGCIEHDINIDFLSGSHLCLNRSWNMTMYERNMEYNLHAINEIVSYNMDILIFAMFGCVFILSMVIVTRTGGSFYGRRK